MVLDLEHKIHLFKRQSRRFDIEESDYWEPGKVEYSKDDVESLCNVRDGCGDRRVQYWGVTCFRGVIIIKMVDTDQARLDFAKESGMQWRMPLSRLVSKETRERQRRTLRSERRKQSLKSRIQRCRHAQCSFY